MILMIIRIIFSVTTCVFVLIDVLSLFQLGDFKILERVYIRSYPYKVVINLLVKTLADEAMSFHYFDPTALSNEVAIASWGCLVNESGPFVERNSVSSDHGSCVVNAWRWVRESLYEASLAVHLKANVKFASYEEDDLRHFIQLIQKGHTFFLKPRLQVLQQVQHHLGVDLIVPREVRISLRSTRRKHRKCPSKCSNEFIV